MLPNGRWTNIYDGGPRPQNARFRRNYRIVCLMSVAVDMRVEILVRGGSAAEGKFNRLILNAVVKLLDLRTPLQPQRKKALILPKKSLISVRLP